MRLSHNLAALSIYKTYTKANSDQSKSLKNISSGYKVDSAKDNPDVMNKSERIKMQIRGLQMAGRNMQNGTSMLQTAEGGLDNMTSIVHRIRELTVQAGSGGNTKEDTEKIQIEINQLIDGYDDIAKNTEFNGIKILSGGNNINDPDVVKRNILVGSNSGEEISVPYYNLTSANVGTSGLSGVDVTSGDISGTLNNLDSVLDSLISVRSKYGAMENRLSSTQNDAEEISQNMESANSKLVDADIAYEMSNYLKNGILSQAGTAMMVQANQFPQDILDMLSNVKN